MLKRQSKREFVQGTVKKKIVCRSVVGEAMSEGVGGLGGR